MKPFVNVPFFAGKECSFPVSSCDRGQDSAYRNQAGLEGETPENALAVGQQNRSGRNLNFEAN